MASPSAPFAGPSNNYNNFCHHGGQPSVAETQADLRAVARKIALCEQALEGRGAYLGITDQATLLDQLKALQRKDGQLREVLLILLRASPFTHTPSPSPTTAPRLPSPPSPPLAPPTPSPSSKALPRRQGYSRRRSIPSGSESVVRRSGGASHGVVDAAPAATPSAGPPPQLVDMANGQKTVSLYEALGLASPPSWEKKVVLDQGESTGSVTRGSGGSSRQHGTHALYRAHGTAGTGSRGHRAPSSGVEATRKNGGGGTGDSVGGSQAVVSPSRVIAASGGGAVMSVPSPVVASLRSGTRRRRALMQHVDAVDASGGGLAGVPSTRQRAGVVNTRPPQGGADEKAKEKPPFAGQKEDGHRDDAVARLAVGNLAGEVIKTEPIEMATTCAGPTRAKPEGFVRVVSKRTTSVPAEVVADLDKRRESDGNATCCTSATVDPALAASPLKLSTAAPQQNSTDIASDVPAISSTAARTPSVGNAAGVVDKVTPSALKEAPVLAAPVEPAEAGMSEVGTTESHTVDVGSPNKRAAVVDEVPASGLSSGGSGRPMRKRRKSSEAGGWRARYNADEFESGDALASGNTSDTESDTETAVKVEKGSGGRARDGGVGREEGKEEWDEDDVDVGGDEDDTLNEEDKSDGGNSGSGLGTGATSGGNSSSGAEREGGGGGSAGGGGRRGGRRVASKNKRDPPNAWKRRCAAGRCQLGASFGRDGQQAVYCSAHRDPGMINVTHRRCESIGCVHQPSFNVEGMKKALYCNTHKKEGMINVCSPRCRHLGCVKRPSFGFIGDRRASFCDSHKQEGMTNIRKARRGSKSPQSGAQSFGEHLQDDESATRSEDADTKPPSFEPSFLSDPPSSGAPSAPPSSMGPTLSGVGDDPALPPGGDAGGGGVGVVPGA